MIQPSDCFEVNLERAAGDVIDGEAIIINLVTGAYYSMQGIGGEIWSMINAGRSAASMLDEIVSTYDVGRDEAERDLDAVLNDLMHEQLIRIATSPAAATAVTTTGERRTYRKPQLQVYRDMEELLALDPPAPGMNQIAWSGNSSER